MFVGETASAALARRASEQPRGASAKQVTQTCKAEKTLAVRVLPIALREERSPTPRLFRVSSLVAAASSEALSWPLDPAASKTPLLSGLALTPSAKSPRGFLARHLGLFRPLSVPLPNPSLNLTRYGKQRKPGLQHAGYPCSPGLRRSPSRAG